MSAWAARRLAQRDAGARVRPVDHPVPPGRDERAHHRRAVRGDRGVAHAAPVPLPGGGEEHHGAAVARQRRAREVDVDLRAAHLDQARLVEADQLADDPLAGGRAGDEHLVVRLELVARHVVLVGLAVADEHVRGVGEAHRREVRLVLVHVEDRPAPAGGHERLDGVDVGNFNTAMIMVGSTLKD